MFNISSFLEKFSKNLKSNELHKEHVLEIIKKHTNIQLSNPDIEIKNYIIEIQGSPAIKNKIFIYKNKILEEIIFSTQTTITDIR